jgi:hypothetical protein
MHLRDDCSHVINEIRPKGLAQPKTHSEISRGDNSNKGKITSQSGKYGFQILFYLLLITVDFRSFGQHVFSIYE